VSSFGKDFQSAITVQIKAEMAAKDWKQSDLAAHVGMHTSTLHRYLAGVRDIPMPVFAEIARSLDLSIVELMGRAQQRKNEDVEPPPEQ
jgi:DNA-binding Xre family transcriptional regulator